MTMMFTFAVLAMMVTAAVVIAVILAIVLVRSRRKQEARGFEVQPAKGAGPVQQ